MFGIWVEEAEWTLVIRGNPAESADTQREELVGRVVFASEREPVLDMSGNSDIVLIIINALCSD